VNIFATIYRANAWNGRESLSGPGSGPAATATVAQAIVELVAELRISSVLDVGCGDGFWMPDLPGYIGIDVVDQAVRAARRRHPGRSYMVAAVADLDRAFDLVIVRDVIQHCSFSDGLALLDAIRRTGSSWLLASTFRGGENIDIPTGDAFSPDLEAEPFTLGEPLRLIADGYGYDDPGAIRDPRKHLGLWPIG
jgi:SAM-dependent methyltransferase